MLTIEDLINLSDEGVNVRLRRAKPSYLSFLSDEDFKLCKGYFDPTSYDIDIFYKHIPSDKEFSISLLHEFIHARDFLLKPNKNYENREEEEALVEAEAEKTYQNKPELVQFIKELYCVRKRSDACTVLTL